MEKKLDDNYTRMLRAICWRQHLIKQQLCSHLPPIKKTIQVRRTRYTGYCWRSRDELISDILLWTNKAGRQARTYLQQLCADTGCSLKNLPGAMDYRDMWRETVREIRASSATWWWLPFPGMFVRNEQYSVTVFWTCWKRHNADSLRMVGIYSVAPQPYIHTCLHIIIILLLTGSLV